ncbi:NADH-ubiquinone oxidoreductase chain J (EC 1.6.5.3) [uncultured Gammaproteobacteria bacterium]|uniref:NADH-quinone oxidoreductase subunit J n=1 Tax=Bathymodiolus heckerae thiotrophic gill symbiont TaxID=1052212 RepID=UPI0010BBFCA1|nr:NADH-quinone oxidoreductase subunit J [Bathymodiolus heckerae thiotrophic gill symbiont]CAC9543500.1 NADH-ubiquinone oxidoreductase chain J (EC 1.6.5.3) [uncultured Gammaproteobacteria bacterium]CAC9594520.1 NADH-ubiquinone oxidoreductase chain J (EC 1.6.5.3) [uncultured Gammaproteobacteria bacterium]CAC9957026.1 NADH-ubiquinone oxidoreductase chain J (EC 1.6.5.3) [uncultured Gammaproteobacteria bacterium]SHN90290.1 NADH-ubiquinone oxidoreductase chain J [Bathymodiolus heckerae thiotrophic g
MSSEQIIFYILSFWFIASSLAMIFARNAAKAVLFLVLGFFSAASIWILLEAEFLAITLILVYVGAVMVLFLFVIKMLNIDKSTLRAKFAGYLPLGLIVALIIIAEMTLVLGGAQFGLEIMPSPERHGADYSNITVLAMQLYTTYVYPFELAAVLLLIAIIAAITLVRKKESTHKKQNVSEQVNVRAKDRVRLVTIASPSKEKK